MALLEGELSTKRPRVQMARGGGRQTHKRSRPITLIPQLGSVLCWGAFGGVGEQGVKPLRFPTSSLWMKPCICPVRRTAPPPRPDSAGDTRRRRPHDTARPAPPADATAADGPGASAMSAAATERRAAHDPRHCDVPPKPTNCLFYRWSLMLEMSGQPLILALQNAAKPALLNPNFTGTAYLRDVSMEALEKLLILG